jgi:putative intracellular protease/amidase
MRKLLPLFIIISIALMMPMRVGCQQKGKVLLLAREHSSDMEFMLTQEVKVMIELIEAAGFQVIVANSTGRAIVTRSITLTANCRYSDVDLRDYVGIIVPCMAEGFTFDAERKEATEIVKQAVALGKPVAAQTGGVIILSEAGVLDGKQFAMRPDKLEYVKNGIYMGSGVIRDGNIITSGICPYTPIETKELYKPDGTKELTLQFIQMILAL